MSPNGRKGGKSQHTTSLPYKSGMEPVRMVMSHWLSETPLVDDSSTCEVNSKLLKPPLIAWSSASQVTPPLVTVFAGALVVFVTL